MWYLYSLASALLAGTSDALAKTALQKSRMQTVAWVKPGWGALVMAPVFLLSHAPHDPSTFWLFVALSLPLEVLASLAFHSSLRTTPLSLSIPFLAFTPVFLLLEEWLFLGVSPTKLGLSGVGLVTVGAFLIQRDVFADGGLSLQGFLPRERGPLLMLLVSFIFSITSIFTKKSLLASSPMYFSSVYFILIAVGLAPFQFTSVDRVKEVARQPLLFFCLGGVEACSFLAQFIATAHAETAYVIAIKRLSLLLSVFFGWLLFGEKHIVPRLVGASFMVAGALCIAFAGT